MPIRAPVTGRCQLTLTVIVTNARGLDVAKEYDLTFLDPHPCVASRAWRLTTAAGDTYDVWLTRHGAECTCPDFIWCRQNAPKPCKHCCALQAKGLLSPLFFPEE